MSQPRVVQDVANILAMIRERGGTLSVQDGRLHCRIPPGALTPDEIKLLTDLKQGLIAALTEQSKLADCSGPAPSGPLSYQQEAYWRWKHADPRYPTSTFAVRLSGDLNSDNLSTALDGLVQRHSALRTRIVSLNGTPRQVVDSPRQFGGLHKVSIDAKAASELSVSAAQYIESLANRHVDWALGPLFRAVLIRLVDRDHILAVLIDHIISDGRSLSLFFEELFSDYESLQRGESRSRSAAPMQYLDYAIWQRGIRQSDEISLEEFWKDRLAGVARSMFPRDSCPERPGQPHLDARKFSFGKLLSAAIHELAEHERTPPSLVVLALYIASLSRWCDQKEIVVGVTVSGRSHAAHCNVIGCFAGTMPLRVLLDETHSFSQLLRLVCQEFYAGSKHLHYGSPTATQALADRGIFNWLGEGEYTMYEHLDGVGLQMHDPEKPAERIYRDGGGLSLEPFSFASARRGSPSVGLPVCVLLFYSDDSICGHVYYRADLFSLQSIQRFENDLCSLARSAVGRPT